MKGPFAFYEGRVASLKDGTWCGAASRGLLFACRTSRRWRAGAAVDLGGASVMRNRTSDRSEHFHAIAAVRTRAKTTMNTQAIMSMK